MKHYRLQEKTVVGAKGNGKGGEPDIQLSGLGIQPEHCTITIEDGGLFLEPLANARSYINGSQVNKRTQLRNGDRIVWGNHHFFRVNCPKSVCKFIELSPYIPITTIVLCLASTSEPQTPAQNIDYNFARDELMLNELSNDPIQAAISRLEKQHEEDKQGKFSKMSLQFVN